MLVIFFSLSLFSLGYKDSELSWNTQMILGKNRFLVLLMPRNWLALGIATQKHLIEYMKGKFEK